jgi:hypothetical protein
MVYDSHGRAYVRQLGFTGGMRAISPSHRTPLADAVGFSIMGDDCDEDETDPAIPPEPVFQAEGARKARVPRT